MTITGLKELTLRGDIADWPFCFGFYMGGQRE
jgi:hypothetical protein